MIVYLITNKINGKKYIGQHIGDDLQKYWKTKVYLAKYKNRHQALSSAILKYGQENFEIRTIATVGSKLLLDFYEIVFIEIFNTKSPNGYNLTDGGEGTSGWSPDEEHRRKISDAHTGKSKPNKLKGVPRTEETRNKISESCKGKKLSEEHVKSLCLASQRRWRREKDKRNSISKSKG
jgi:group I intron endonuclease